MPSPSLHPMNTPTVSNSHLEELGHQTVGLGIQQITKSFTKGFLTGLILNRVFQINGSRDRRVASLAIGTGFAADSFVSEYAKEISYQHEYAREVWEHEFNAMGEVDEYVSYGISRGLTPERAKEIAIIITCEPSVSVPYHLAFELGLLEPSSYQQKLKHSTLVAVGFTAGSLVSEAACILCDRLRDRGTAFYLPLSVAVCCVGVLPIMGIRYKHIGKVAGSGSFQIAAGITLTLLISGALSLDTLLK